MSPQGTTGYFNFLRETQCYFSSQQKKVAVPSLVSEFEKLAMLRLVGADIPLGSNHGYLQMK